MKQPMIVSNIRLPRSDWLQIKAVAAEAGISVNEYIRHAVAKAQSSQAFVAEARMPAKRAPIWNVAKLAKKHGHPRRLSKEDEAIYG